MKRKFFLMLLFPLSVAAQPAVDSLLSVVSHRFDASDAYDHVKFFSQFWRIAGGKDFNMCIEYIVDALDSAGLSPTNHETAPEHSVGVYYIQRDSLTHPVWNPRDARLAVVSPVETTLQRYALTPVMLCQNSFEVDTTVELVYVGKGNSESDYTGIDVRGKIVFADTGVTSLSQRASSHGALGVVSSMVRPYNHPELFPDIISEERIPYNEAEHSFGLKISARNATFLQSLFIKEKVFVHVSIATAFTTGELRTLVAEIPGTVKPNERVIYVAHLDHYKPGANDNASGSATMVEMISTLASLTADKTISPPERTMTFIWVDEYNGTRAWIKTHPSEVENTIAVFNLDMTGEDASKTGGQFWMERVPDPASVWLRPPDKYTQWGAPTLTETELLPTWLNDFYFSMLERYAARSNWKVGQHPFTGGSDNEPFVQARIPAVTSWHFTDYFYHSNMDDTDKVSPLEMKNVGTAALAAGYAVASPGEEIFQFAIASLNKAAERRLGKEADNSKAALDSVGRSQHQYFLQRQKEKEILDAWMEWYDAAYLSLKRLPLILIPSHEESIEQGRSALRSLHKGISERLGID